VPYFDPTNEEHLKLLPTDMREASDLTNVAAEAEADVIQYFTSEDPPTSSLDYVELQDDDGYGIGRYVCLRGYATDPTEAETFLQTAMRREIAGVIRWRLKQREKDPLIASESSGEFKGRTFRNDAEQPFPPGFGRWLRPFDTRRPLESI